MSSKSGVLLVAASLVAAVNSELLQAIAVLTSEDNKIQGNITFSQNDGGAVTIWGKIVGLNPGKHAFHIHQKGDISDSCHNTGAHYNPFKSVHGGLTDLVRHIGDLGNIAASADGVALVSISDNVIALTGPYSVLGRTLSVHANEDDLGRGGQTESLNTGNAGSQLACGVIGILSSLDRWEDTSSTAAFSAPIALVLSTAALIRFIM